MNLYDKYEKHTNLIKVIHKIGRENHKLLIHPDIQRKIRMYQIKKYIFTVNNNAALFRVMCYNSLIESSETYLLFGRIYYVHKGYIFNSPSNHPTDSLFIFNNNTYMNEHLLVLDKEYR